MLRSSPAPMAGSGSAWPRGLPLRGLSAIDALGRDPAAAAGIAPIRRSPGPTCNEPGRGRAPSCRAALSSRAVLSSRDYRLCPGGIMPPFHPRFSPWLQPGGTKARLQPCFFSLLNPDESDLPKLVLAPLKEGALAWVPPAAAPPRAAAPPPAAPPPPVPLPLANAGTVVPAASAIAAVNATTTNLFFTTIPFQKLLTTKRPIWFLCSARTLRTGPGVSPAPGSGRRGSPRHRRRGSGR
jgi:hypothetical protein